jgi:drug/metabolite transporter (DMT)-like permease
MNTKLGIGLKILAALCATLMLACIKGLNGEIPTGQVVFFRSIVALVPLLIWLGLQGNVIELTRTKHLGGHLIRGLSGTGGMFFNYIALIYLPLADATALSYAAPLFTVILAAVLLGETVRIYRWSAVAIGFLGVLVMLFPHLGTGPSLSSDCLGSGIILGTSFALTAALCSALSSVQIRHLGKTEKPGAIVLYFSLMTTVIGLSTSLLGWTWPSMMQLMLLCGGGVFGGLSQILITVSLRHAHASLLAPFDYTTMIWSVIIGYLFLSQAPNIATIIGAVIVASAGMFAIWREQRQIRTLRLAQTVLNQAEA